RLEQLVPDLPKGAGVPRRHDEPGDLLRDMLPDSVVKQLTLYHPPSALLEVEGESVGNTVLAFRSCDAKAWKKRRIAEESRTVPNNPLLQLLFAVEFSLGDRHSYLSKWGDPCCTQRRY